MSLAKECRRIFVSGAKCGALAVKGTNYCFFHQAARDFHRENVKRYKSIVVPPIEDRASIHVALQATLDAIGSNRMDPGRARVYLYALQLAMQNIGKDGVPFASDKSVTNPVCRDDEEYLAPKEIDPDEIDSDEINPDEDHEVEIHNDAQPPSAHDAPSANAALKGHDFSRAINGHYQPWALAPEGSSSNIEATESSAQQDDSQPPSALDDLKGHYFSRAAKAGNLSGALAPEGGRRDRGPHGQVLICGVDDLQVPDSVTKAFGPPSRENSRKPVVAESSQDDQSLNAESIDISASADDETHSDYEEEPAHSLSRYGLVRVWQYEDGELTEDELRKHQYVDGLINHTLRALYAAKPFRSPADRRQLREQTRSEFYNEYLVPRPEPRNCTVTTRYCALLLS